MRFSTTVLAYLATGFLSALAPQVAQAGITAFSGSSCDGNAGLNVPCDGSCHKFDDRHSFRVRIFPLQTSRVFSRLASLTETIFRLTAARATTA